MTDLTPSPDVARRVAKALLEIGAIQLRTDPPFRWSSGWNSPIYCDNRLSLSYPAVRTFIKNALAGVIRQQFPDAEAVAGVATAGIPQGALVADVLGLPFLYVRSKPKEHGMSNMIEGRTTPRQRIVVLEDLVSTGGSSLKVVDALREADCDVLGMVAIFTYGFDVARRHFDGKKVPLYCLSDYAHLLDEAVRTGLLSPTQHASLQAWREDPENWRK
jgi:orotate phosphoribosyltransferase